MPDLYVCDNLKHLREVMNSNFNSWDVFMTIRNFNKMKKNFPFCIQKMGVSTHYIHEGNGEVKKYYVKRCRREDAASSTCRCKT